MVRLHAEERRKQLLAVAREEFARVGPEGARISDIARLAGVNVALLYRYFDSKEQLFEEAIVEPIDHLLQDVLAQTIAGSINGSSEAVKIFYRSLLLVFVEYLDLFNVVLFRDRDSGQEFYLRRIAPFIDSLVDQVRSADELWSQKADPRLTAPMCVGMCWGVAMDAHFRGIDLDAEGVAETLAAMTLNGLSGRPPSS
ncbi:TetR/AcrR family transcriptional regulator [Aeromicrobium choanae]|uniref:Transcriptional regulator, TetR family n=1 Tax=Aeromicrobium choanae TaxID=1736691 RepID=A0A1T4Z667_9ACTN|nr:TetR/AcrR family transcriptional regulator [Aeromicrobium choanae]SKB09446.1 transcriptional regulator, TetR family [Aeromicrobium choanae]